MMAVNPIVWLKIKYKEIYTLCTYVYTYHAYSGFIYLGANFPEWSVHSFSRSFPNLEIHDSNWQSKTHVSEIYTKFDAGNRRGACL